MTQSVRDLLFWGVFWMIPMVVTVGAAYFFLSLPARRNERARLFLDLLETGIESGQSPERTIVAISETRDRSVTVQFHLLASYIEEGMNLERALVLTPNFLPPNVAEAVKIGSSEGALPQLLPAARTMLNDAKSRLRGAVNYVVVFLIVILPAGFFVLPGLSMFIWPKLRQVLADLEIPEPAMATMVFENIGWTTAAESVLVAFLLFAAFFYVGGARAKRWTNFFLGKWPDRFLLWMPWRRARMQRDFTGTLAILLDAGVREERAVELAGRAAANRIFEKRAREVVAALKEGVTLPEAIRFVERDEQFHWRWRNALRGGMGFFAALKGWQETLEARAFRQEQAAAHAITTGIVIVNGVLVGLITAAVFLVLISVFEEAVLW